MRAGGGGIFGLLPDLARAVRRSGDGGACLEHCGVHHELRLPPFGLDGPLDYVRTEDGSPAVPEPLPPPVSRLGTGETEPRLSMLADFLAVWPWASPWELVRLGRPTGRMSALEVWHEQPPSASGIEAATSPTTSGR